MRSYQFPNKSDLFLTDILIICIYIWNITTFLSYNNLRQTKYYDYTLAMPSQFLQPKCHVNYLIRFNFTLFNLSLHNITGRWRGTPWLRKVWGAWSRWPLKEEKKNIEHFPFQSCSKHFQLVFQNGGHFLSFVSTYAVISTSDKKLHDYEVEMYLFVIKFLLSVSLNNVFLNTPLNYNWR